MNFSLCSVSIALQRMLSIHTTRDTKKGRRLVVLPLRVVHIVHLHSNGWYCTDYTVKCASLTAVGFWLDLSAHAVCWMWSCPCRWSLWMASCAKTGKGSPVFIFKQDRPAPGARIQLYQDAWLVCRGLYGAHWVFSWKRSPHLLMRSLPSILSRSSEHIQDYSVLGLKSRWPS